MRRTRTVHILVLAGLMTLAVIPHVSCSTPGPASPTPPVPSHTPTPTPTATTPPTPTSTPTPQPTLTPEPQIPDYGSFDAEYDEVDGRYEAPVPGRDFGMARWDSETNSWVPTEMKADGQQLNLYFYRDGEMISPGFIHPGDGFYLTGNVRQVDGIVYLEMSDQPDGRDPMWIRADGPYIPIDQYQPPPPPPTPTEIPSGISCPPGSEDIPDGIGRYDLHGPSDLVLANAERFSPDARKFLGGRQQVYYGTVRIEAINLDLKTLRVETQSGAFLLHFSEGTLFGIFDTNTLTYFDVDICKFKEGDLARVHLEAPQDGAFMTGMWK